MIPTSIKATWAAFKDISIYLVVVLVLVFYIEHATVEVQDSIRGELNELGFALCEKAKQQDSVGHYNAALDALIADLDARRDENISRGDWSKALINVKTAEALKLAKLPPTPQDCTRPLLPARG